ncbi:EAL domain-containing protein, partial [Rhizobium ruizarguesonis]
RMIGPPVRLRRYGAEFPARLLARSLDIPVTAEGIETEEQAIAMRLFGCDCLQGYWFGKPVTSDLITEMLNERRAAGPETRRRIGAA